MTTGQFNPPYGNAMPATGYGPQLSFTMPPGAELASVGRRIGGYFLELLLAILTLGIGYLIRFPHHVDHDDHVERAQSHP